MAIGRLTPGMYTPYRSLLRDALELAYEWRGLGDTCGAEDAAVGAEHAPQRSPP
jgi:hypothetical protein